MKQITHFAMIALIFIACAGVRTVPMNVPFDVENFQPFAGSGTSTITGQAFLKTRSGDVKYGAGNTVMLIPRTNYTDKWLNITIHGGNVDDVDARMFGYFREIVADGNGNFEFRNIPAGEYYLKCAIYWEVPSRYGLHTTGGIAMTRVIVNPGETIKVVLTR